MWEQRGGEKWNTGEEREKRRENLAWWNQGDCRKDHGDLNKDSTVTSSLG